MLVNEARLMLSRTGALAARQQVMGKQPLNRNKNIKWGLLFVEENILHKHLIKEI